jgi:hypothetical protein
LTIDDVVHVRAVHSPGYNPCDLTTSHEITATVSFTSPAEFIVDRNGDVWSGDSGSYIFEHKTGYPVAMRLSGTLRMRGFYFVESYTGNYNGGWLQVTESSKLLDGAIQIGAPGAEGVGYNYMRTTGSATIDNCYIDVYKKNTYSGSHGRLFETSGIDGGVVRITNTVIDFRGMLTADSQTYLYSQFNAAGSAELKNLKILGTDRIINFVYPDLGNGAKSYVIFDGVEFDTPSLLKDLANINYGVAQSHNSDVQKMIVGVDGKFGFFSAGRRGMTSWIEGLNYPCLSAILPDKTTPWSILALPNSTINDAYPFEMHPFKSYYGDAASQLVVKVELTVEEYYTSPLDDEYWITVSYTDSTGKLRSDTSKGTGSALATSTAQWSGLVGNVVPYGSQTLYRYKIELTTTYAVKQNSMVVTTLTTNRPSGNNTHFYFVDPQPSLTAV